MDDKELPLVSICIPTYNSAKYIDKMLNSIIDQTYRKIEVIISDNCSTDSTLKILQQYIGHRNWHITQNESNIGALANINKLIKLAKGEYTAIYHSDDLYEPIIIEKSVAVFQADPTVSIVSTLGHLIDSDDEVISTFKLPETFKGKRSLPFGIVFLEILSQRPFFVITPSVMTKTIYYKDRTFLPKYNSASDYGMWFDLMQEGNLYIINENLIKYRVHDQQGSQLEIKEHFDIPDSILLYQDYAEKNKDLYWPFFKYSYFKLMLIQAIKLNNQGNFKKSLSFLDLIAKKSDKYLSPWIIFFTICNRMSIKFSLKHILLIKKFIKMV